MPDKELSAYAEKVASLPFVTNDGVSMTYGSAIEEICDVVQKQAQKVTRTGAVLSQPLFLLPEEDLSVLLLTDFVHDLLAPFAEICSLLLSYDGPKIGTSWCSRCQPSGHHGSSVSMTLRTRWSSMSFFPCWAALSRQWVQSLFTAREDPAE